MAAVVTIHEYDSLVPGEEAGSWVDGACQVPPAVFQWLQSECLRAGENGETPWLRFARRGRRLAIQVTSYVGVVRTAGGLQLEVLPKTGKANVDSVEATRELLIRMLSCLPGFRHIVTESATLRAARMPLLEVFIAEFLDSAGAVVKRGLRSDYVLHEGNLPALRGKLLVSQQVRQNLVRADRFWTEHDEFTADRPENRLLKAAVERALFLASTRPNQQLAREVLFALADIPCSIRIVEDFRKVRLDRGMGAYHVALGWAKLILEQMSPLTATGGHEATSLLFPMEAVFEAFVARHLPRQLADRLKLKTQTSAQHLVRHLGQGWFRLRPDLLIEDEGRSVAVLDTKWKLLDSLQANGMDKYGLSQADFYQLQAYGQSYLDGKGDVFLVFPRTDTFQTPLPVFEFPKPGGVRLWVVPFCLDSRRLAVHQSSVLALRLQDAGEVN